jgi:ribose-phosphate pyrophosphokinase
LGKKVKVFTLSSNPELAQEICDSIGIPLSDCEVLHFADGEINVQINESVRGHHVFIIQPTSAPVNDHLMEVLIMCDALKRASAKTINLVIPYYGYSRQDRKAISRQRINANLVSDLLQVAGADRVITMDIHAAQEQGFVVIPVDNFMGLPILVNYLMDKHLKDVVVVSPDHGGATRAREFAKILEAPMAIIDKRRPEPHKMVVMNLIGEVNGKTCILVDDMVNTAGTLAVGAQA